MHVGDLTAVDARCPQCRDAVRGDAAWCGQCYASLLPVAGPPVEDPVAGPQARAVAPRVAVQLLPEELRIPSADEATWPCETCGASNAMAETACGACGAAFLSALRASEPPLLELPGVGDVAALSRLQRLGLGAAVVVAVVVLTLLLALLTL